jgi:hypothetical protein
LAKIHCAYANIDRILFFGGLKYYNPDAEQRRQLNLNFYRTLVRALVYFGIASIDAVQHAILFFANIVRFGGKNCWWACAKLFDRDST